MSERAGGRGWDGRAGTGDGVRRPMGRRFDPPTRAKNVKISQSVEIKKRRCSARYSSFPPPKLSLPFLPAGGARGGGGCAGCLWARDARAMRHHGACCMCNVLLAYWEKRERGLCTWTSLAYPCVVAACRHPPRKNENTQARRGMGEDGQGPYLRANRILEGRSGKQRKKETGRQGRDRRTARRHHTGILRRGVWCVNVAHLGNREPKFFLFTAKRQ